MIESVESSHKAALAFQTLLNKPESIAIVRIFTEDTEYWKRSLNYLIDGNLQSMLDEFLYLLVDGEKMTSPTEVSEYVIDILSIRTSGLEVDDLTSFLNKTKNRSLLRTHYSLDFGIQKVASGKGTNRLIGIRQAFNSPFRPFVLSSTSIGQEGLDFHFYCRKIFHWNLPSNPIDFEQREGRIHRFQGLVIRQNLAAKYGNQLDRNIGKNIVWRNLFDLGVQEKEGADLPCDLIPFWHTTPQKGLKIERFVPLYPFSRDVERYENMMKILTFYRMTFGQPRQEELIDALRGKGVDPDFLNSLNKLLIELSPIKFSQ